MSTELQLLVGDRDGSNTTFQTPTPYTHGSIKVFHVDAVLPSGQVTETDPALGVVDLDIPPEASDLLLAAYSETPAPSPDGTRIGLFLERLAELNIGGGNDHVIMAGESGALLTFTAYDRDGDRVDLGVYTLYFAAKEDATGSTIAIDKTSLGEPDWDGIVPRSQGTSDGRGRADIVFDDGETLALAGKILIYDLWARDSEGNISSARAYGRIEVRAGVRTTWPTP